MHRLSHPYIVQLIGICEEPSLMLVQELVRYEHEKTNTLIAILYRVRFDFLKNLNIFNDAIATNTNVILSPLAVVSPLLMHQYIFSL